MKGIITIYLLLFFLNSKSQDIINLKDGNEIYSKVIKISEKEIEYKKFSNLDGPSYVKNTSEILSIKFSNGSIEKFDEKNATKNTDSKTAFESFKSDENSIVIQPPANDGKGIAKVKQINGLDVYFMCQPLLVYRIVFNSGDILSDIDLKSIALGGLARAHVDDKMQKIVNAAFRKSEKEKIPIHGVIYTGGNKAIAIQYIDNNLNAVRLAKVEKLENVEVYVLNEPYEKEYEIINNASAKSGGFTAMASYGIVNSNMEDDINNLVDRLNPKKNKLDAVIYVDGKKGNGIRFKSKD